MRRIIWHWTAGGHKANATDRRHYHFIIEADGAVVAGNHPPEANKRPIAKPNDASTYAAHTRAANTDAIGIALAGMRQAVERPFSAGPSPITNAQVGAMATLTANLCKRYAIPVSRETTLSHAEVQTTLGIAQRGKWDIRWLPGMAGAGDAVQIGDQLRARVQRQMGPLASSPVADSQAAPRSHQNIIAAIIAAILSLFKR
jgi:hypothetical protein